jgi:hypothetical protein
VKLVPTHISKSARPSLRSLALAICAALTTLLLAVPGASGGSASPRAHAAASYLTGIGDEQLAMFSDPMWQQLHTKIVRYIVAYDAAVRPDDMAKAHRWIAAAEAQHQQVLIAFYHSEHAPTKLPSVSVYQKDVAKFVKEFPKVRQYQSWDESNRGNIKGVLASPSAVAAARYYQALIRVCSGCTVLGLDVLDAANITPTLRYISEYKREISRLRTVMPKIWGLHNYSDINRLESWRTRELIRALGGQVWLTETGGIVQFKPSFPNNHGAGLTRAAKVTKYMFAVAAKYPQLKRLYIYDWTGGNKSTRFDAGLTNSRHQPRAAYVVLCRQLHAAKCSVKTASN